MSSLENPLIIDIDLTLYSAAEFVEAHPMDVRRWAQAMFRFNPEIADESIDRAWVRWQPQIEMRIESCRDLSVRKWGRPPLFLTANPLTATKLRSFSRFNLQPLSSFPLKKLEWAQERPHFVPAILSVGDRKTDAPLGQNFLHLPLTSPIHRLRDQNYSQELQERICLRISKI